MLHDEIICIYILCIHIQIHVFYLFEKVVICVLKYHIAMLICFIYGLYILIMNTVLYLYWHDIHKSEMVKNSESNKVGTVRLKWFSQGKSTPNKQRENTYRNPQFDRN